MNTEIIELTLFLNNNNDGKAGEELLKNKSLIINHVFNGNKKQTDEDINFWSIRFSWGEYATVFQN